jgi:hypothetical protein
VDGGTNGAKKENNALRRKYQRTTNNDTLRQERKAQYFDGRREYESKLQDAKLKSWETFCTINDGANSWNIVYKIAPGKRKTSTKLTTLEKEPGTYTVDTRSTLMHVLKHFAPDDSEDSDNDQHKKVRKDIQEPTDTADDKAFTKEEIIANLKKFNPKKTRGWSNQRHFNKSFPSFPRVFYTNIQCVSKEGLLS